MMKNVEAKQSRKIICVVKNRKEEDALAHHCDPPQHRCASDPISFLVSYGAHSVVDLEMISDGRGNIAWMVFGSGSSACTSA